jgi:hypothetical protein
MRSIASFIALFLRRQMRAFFSFCFQYKKRLCVKWGMEDIALFVNYLNFSPFLLSLFSLN